MLHTYILYVMHHLIKFSGYEIRECVVVTVELCIVDAVYLISTWDNISFT